MKIDVKLSRLKETRWSEYAVRFLFGAVATVITGWIAQEYGPKVGGLFLAFPAILPCSITLVERHEQRRKTERGLTGKKRARDAAAVTAAGAALGSVGLFTFAAIVWQFAGRLNAAPVLFSATFVWFVISGIAWIIRQKL